MSIEKRIRQPQPRSGHVAATCGEFMLVWGGYYDVLSGDYVADRYMHPEEVWVYHTEMDRWHCQKTTGEIPPGTSGAYALVVNHYMYVLFGHTLLGNTSDIYRLNLFTWQWEGLHLLNVGKTPSPRDKLAAWEFNNCIYIFGGFGLPIHHFLNENGSFFLDATTWSPSRGWNNQLHILDLEKMTWSNPGCKGTPPSPRAAHAAARVGDKVYVFGGRHNANRLNDLHCLHLPTLTWSGSLIVDGEIPAGRSWHSLTAVSDSHLLLFGGYSQENRPLGDCWLLDLCSLQWRHVEIGEARPRLWHTGCCTEDGSLLIFGGCSNDILSVEHPSCHSNDLLVLRCSPLSLVRLCLDRVYNLRPLLQSEWSSLPQTLAKRLLMKLPEFDTSMMAGGEGNGTNGATSHQATTCAIS